MKHDWTAEILTYWDRLRGTRAAPDRRDISPRSLGSKLPNIFVLQVESTNAETDNAYQNVQASDVQISDTHQPDFVQIRWQFRLAGTRLCAFYGRELRNTRFLSLWSEELRPWLSEQLHLSALDYRPFRLEHLGVSLNEKQCRFETILLPLHEADGSIGWLGSTVALDSPLWLGSDLLISNQLAASQSANGSPVISNNLHHESDLAAQLHPVQGVHKPSGLKSILEALLERHLPALEESTDASPAMRNKAKQRNQVHQQQIMLSDLLADGVISMQTHTAPTPQVQSPPVIADTSMISDTMFARELLPQIEQVLAQFSANPSPDDTGNASAHSLQQFLNADSRAKQPMLSSSSGEASPQTEANAQPSSPHPAKPNQSASPHLTLIPGGKR